LIASYGAQTCSVILATGIYFEALANSLYDAGAGISVINPVHVQDFGKCLDERGKTDAKGGRPFQ